ncbi:AAA family ATPase [Bifidobacterium breve]|uniref:AAA family ATPase n=1 Tax=Bifidobacterium breve TaxID=1685 RepID=UPI0021553E89|nr:AAA family ATPase [Bifidobacterium breve]
MLLNFTVENCLSFKSEQEFTMLRKDRHGTQEEQGGAWSRIPPPVAVIYGDNAAGKSNLLKCMNFFSNFVRNSFALREGINTQLFLLDRESAK